MFPQILLIISFRYHFDMEGMQYLCIRPLSISVFVSPSQKQTKRQAFWNEKNKRRRILFHFELKTWAWFDFFQGREY